MSTPRFTNRLADLIAAAGINDVRLAERAGTTKQQVGKLKRGEIRMSKEWAVRLATHLGCEWTDILGVPPSTLPAPKPSPDDGVEYQGATYVALPIFDVAVSAGPGAINAAHPQPEAWHLFAQAALRSLTRAALDNLAMVRVAGDSMTPTLANGDLILVDRSIQTMGRDGLYVIAAGDEVMVKRLSRDFATRTLTIASDNQAYRPSLGVPEDGITILGRVVWLSRNLGG